MQTIIVMCGIPRSGKTTYAKEYLKDYIRVSVDDIISMTTQTFNLKFGDLYTQIEGIIIRKLISKKLNIVIDRTALTVKSRKRMINRVVTAAKEMSLPRPLLKLIVVETPIDISIDRNVKTGKVPPEILKKMINSFEEPTLDEGWDEIVKISGGDKI